MNIIERVKSILVKPKQEWLVINGESTSASNLAINYLLPLAIVAALATFIGVAFIMTYGSTKLGMFVALRLFVSLIVAVYVAGYIADAVAPSFGSEKNLNKSMQLVGYSATPIFIACIIGLFPDLLWLGLVLGSVFAIYLLFLGLPVLKKTPEDKIPIYLIVIVLSEGVVYWLANYIITRIFFSSMFGYYNL
jgi:Yip1-like protein